MLDVFKTKKKVGPLEWQHAVTKWDIDVLSLISVDEHEAKKVSRPPIHTLSLSRRTHCQVQHV